MPKRYGGAMRARRPYHQRADWLWNPIPTNPVLDTNSAAIVSTLTAPAGTYTGQTSNQTSICDMVQFGCSVVTDITSSTPRYDVAFANVPAWGADPFGTETVPFPRTTTQRIPNVGTDLDKHLTVIDPTHNKVFNHWVTAWNPTSSNWTANWGAMCDLDGDGRETGGSSTGAGLSRIAGIIRVSEIAARYIPHALFFSTNIAKATSYRYPATKTDGNGNSSSVGVPVANQVEEGMRLQLDPSINLAAISGITPGELAIGRCLQTYGAYCGDNGGAAMAFLFELESDSDLATNTPGSVYTGAGLTSDYFTLSKLPWSTGLRVLRAWDGS